MAPSIIAIPVRYQALGKIAHADPDNIRPALQAIHVTATHLEVTDSYRLVRIEHGQEVASDFQDFMVPARFLKMALSGAHKSTPRVGPQRRGPFNTPPGIRYFTLSCDGDRVTVEALIGAGLGETITTVIPATQGSFPDLADVLGRFSKHKNPEPRTILNVDLMHSLSACLKDLGCHHIELEWADPLKPVLMKGKTVYEHTITALQMPVRP